MTDAVTTLTALKTKIETEAAALNTAIPTSSDRSPRMARTNKLHVKIGDGPAARAVGYSVTKRGGDLGVRFVGPDGRRLERMTACKKQDANFALAVERIVAAAYAPVCVDPGRVDWDTALDEVERTAPDLRPATMVAYRKAVRIVRATMAAPAPPQDPAGPADVGPEAAGRFGRLWLAGTFKRSKAAAATEYRRSPTTLAFYLRQLSALWGQFVELGYARDNPWKGVRKPNTERRRKPVPTEDEVNSFFAWVTARYPAWERLHAFLDLKALSGCRTSDICQLRTSQLRDGRVEWTPDQTKNKEGRAVLLPPEFFDKLRRLAGREFLWEGFVDDLKAYRRSRNRSSDQFDPRTVFWCVNNIFREFNEAHPGRRPLSPHGLRRRAITLVAMARGRWTPPGRRSGSTRTRPGTTTWTPSGRSTTTRCSGRPPGH